MRKDNNKFRVSHYILGGGEFIGDDLPHLVPNSHVGRGPKGYVRSDDRINEEVSEILYRSDGVDASDINVEVIEGCVFLKGEVESRQMKRLAQELIENVRGIQDVINELTIRGQDQ